MPPACVSPLFPSLSGAGPTLNCYQHHPSLDASPIHHPISADLNVETQRRAIRGPKAMIPSGTQSECPPSCSRNAQPPPPSPTVVIIFRKDSLPGLCASRIPLQVVCWRKNSAGETGASSHHQKLSPLWIFRHNRNRTSLLHSRALDRPSHRDFPSLQPLDPLHKFLVDIVKVGLLSEDIVSTRPPPRFRVHHVIIPLYNREAIPGEAPPSFQRRPFRSF